MRTSYTIGAVVGAPEAGSWRGHLLAALVFLLALALRFHVLIGEDATRVALLPDRGPASLSLHGLVAGDLRGYAIWLPARNARTLLHRPSALFQAEPCYPAESALALGEPGVTLGLLGTPAWAVTGDPFLTFHFTLLASVWLAAFAMYLLVRAWTAELAAGLVAGLLFAFHGIRIVDVVHPYIWDNAWTVLALFFAERLFATGRWRDAVGLAACAALQIGGSLYPLAGSAALALPLLGWLFVRHGVRHLRPGPVLVALVLVAVAAAGLFGPYLELHAAGGLARRPHFFLAWAELAPGGSFFPGWPLLLLALAGLALRPPDGRPDPRWPLLGAWLLATYLAAGGNQGDRLLMASRGEPLGAELPNLYGALAAVVPGLDVIRAPSNLYTGAHLALCILSGLGAAALLRRVPPRLAAAAATALVAVVALETLRPPLPGVSPRPPLVAVELAPSRESLEFYRELEARGNEGPILEIPFNLKNARSTSAAVLLAAYHHRRTAACWASQLPGVTLEVLRVAAGLPDAHAVRALADLGFTTLVVRHDIRMPGWTLPAFERRVARLSDGTLRELHRADSLSAWQIAPAAAP